ncbi:MAG: SgcJ/EcaC family oxidoreductase [Chloroflexi bacterium]|nr:MAG: SgcJ/EcaC family oxidoreductase [Chloroflexota bacterium]
MSRAIVFVSAALLVVGGPLRLTAQQPSGANVRTEIQQAVRAYVDAINKADAATLVEMYSREAGVTSVGDGQITRGWDGIRSTADSIAGAEGKYKVATGSIDVSPLGPGYALALTSTILTVKSGEQEVQLRGAMTLVFKKIGAEWRIIHDHTSTVTPTSASGGGGAAAPAAPAQAPRPTPPERAAAAPQSAAPTAPQPTRTAIAESEAAIVQPGQFLYYPFSIPPSTTCAVTGRIVGLAGGNKDFQALVLDENNFLNWKTSHQAQAYWQSGQVAATNIGVRLTGPATYYLVISNVFSPVTAKTVKVQAQAEC